MLLGISFLYFTQMHVFENTALSSWWQYITIFAKYICRLDITSKILFDSFIFNILSQTTYIQLKVQCLLLSTQQVNGLLDMDISFALALWSEIYC